MLQYHAAGKGPRACLLYARGFPLAGVCLEVLPVVWMDKHVLLLVYPGFLSCHVGFCLVTCCAAVAGPVAACPPCP